ncbi:unnamed protein product [Pleuronectes platessa]|uniref:Uncharacterized protein n=1 Tax=Pleuronectes platessa TaxID=8262 RepID=A0A9N7YCP8_PLEPL|nr:unnamed protein product [Pleuronectes platessa]
MSCGMWVTQPSRIPSTVIRPSCVNRPTLPRQEKTDLGSIRRRKPIADTPGRSSPGTGLHHLSSHTGSRTLMQPLAFYLGEVVLHEGCRPRATLFPASTRTIKPLDRWIQSTVHRIQNSTHIAQLQHGGKLFGRFPANSVIAARPETKAGRGADSGWNGGEAFVEAGPAGWTMATTHLAPVFFFGADSCRMTDEAASSRFPVISGLCVNPSAQCGLFSVDSALIPCASVTLR